MHFYPEKINLQFIHIRIDVNTNQVYSKAFGGLIRLLNSFKVLDGALLQAGHYETQITRITDMENNSLRDTDNTDNGHG